MLATTGLALHLLAALGVIGLAAKYAFGPVPAAYHAQIFERAGETPSPAVLMVLRAVYQALAGILVAVAIGIAALSFAGWRGGATLPVIGALTAIAFAAGGVSALVTWRMARGTGVRTPWRPALGLMVTVLVGAALML